MRRQIELMYVDRLYIIENKRRKMIREAFFSFINIRITLLIKKRRRKKYYKDL